LTDAEHATSSLLTLASCHFATTTTAAFLKQPERSPACQTGKCPRGLSDAKVFAEFGIPTVNLSVGYQHEHTEFETLDYKAALETVMLLETVLENNMIHDYRRTRRNV
jgi:putative aminopeptidase FrvX